MSKLGNELMVVGFRRVSAASASVYYEYLLRN
jgi:hypothetical protein